MSQFPDSAFWDFSLEVYGTDGVPPACLGLQERHDADVNLLLYCTWLGYLEGTPAAPERIDALGVAVDEWHEAVVRQLRAVRKRLKEPVADEDRELALSLRQRIQKIEIDAEHVEQLMLEATDPGQPAANIVDEQAEAAALENMRCYLARLSNELNASDDNDLRTIARAARQFGPV